jgi:dTDP-4-amino-4,6-dideoxygalactose transaminase
VQAAIGLLQLAKLPEWTARRQANARVLADGLSTLPGLRVPAVPDHVGHAWYRFSAFVRPDELDEHWDRDRVMAALNGRGVGTTVGSCSEIYREQAFVRRGWGPEKRLPVARELGETSLTFLVHPTLTRPMLDRTVDIVTTVMHEAAR